MPSPVAREVLLLVGIVVLIDVLFGATYFAAGIQTASDPVKMGFTALWTVVTLVAVIRGLTRVRSARTSSRAT